MSREVQEWPTHTKRNIHSPRSVTSFDLSKEISQIYEDIDEKKKPTFVYFCSLVIPSSVFITLSSATTLGDTLENAAQPSW